MSRGNRTLQIRLPPDVRERWDAAARAAGKSLVELVRDLVERALEQPR